MAVEQMNMDAYIAGFFDGDGSVGLTTHIGNNERVTFSPRIDIEQNYIAGLFDAEGCVKCSIEENGRGGNISMKPITTLNLIEKDKGVLYMIQQYLGQKKIKANIYIYNRGENREPIVHFTVYGWRNVKRFLELIYPYSIVKKEQIRIMLEKIMPKLKPLQEKGRGKFTRSRVIEIMGYVDEMNKLKGRRKANNVGKYMQQYFREKWDIWD